MTSTTPKPAPATPQGRELQLGMILGGLPVEALDGDGATSGS